MFAHSGHADQERSRHPNSRLRRCVSAILLAFLTFPTSTAYAQRANSLAPSPVHWLLSKAEADENTLDHRRTIRSGERALLKVYRNAADSANRSERYALKFSDADEIRGLRAEIVSLYGAPSDQSDEQDIWNIHFNGAGGFRQFTLTYQVLPNSDVLIGVEAGHKARAAAKVATGKL